MHTMFLRHCCLSNCAITAFLLSSSFITLSSHFLLIQPRPLFSSGEVQPEVFFIALSQLFVNSCPAIDAISRIPHPPTTREMSYTRTASIHCVSSFICKSICFKSLQSCSFSALYKSLWLTSAAPESPPFRLSLSARIKMTFGLDPSSEKLSKYSTRPSVV